uniref:EOG090X089S n=1 Tax=Moina brachiata TaxID=675436 RepID=A0A4Y7NJM3_9CRUS|nr:EOG090X089S [Moina brachiata]SVE93083.1 EOG090X089S [Moina brachiata]
MFGITVLQFGKNLALGRSGIQRNQRLLCSYALNSEKPLLVPFFPLVLSQRNAARKGTRERKSKQKVKAEIVKKEDFVPYKVKMARLHVPEGPRRALEKNKPEAIDDVFVTRHFMTRAISLAEAVQFHRETNHPTVYNNPEALLTMQVELDMKLEKKNRYLDNFHRILLLPHRFEYQPERKILALCKTQETQTEALNAGAQAVGGLDLIKRIQSGEVSLADYDYYVAHTNMMQEVLQLRGLMKRKLPNIRSGSMGPDLAKMIGLFSKGLEFSSSKDQYELDYGLVEVPFGRLPMPSEQLEANFAAILKDVESCRGKPSGDFITRVYVVSPPSPEKFVVSPDTYIGKKIADSSSSSSSSDESDDDEAEKPDEDEEDASRVRLSK